MKTRAAGRGVAVGCVLVLGLLTGCSASDSGSSAVPDSGKGVQAPAAAGDKANGAAADGGAAAPADPTAGRQVITNGAVQLTVDDPRAAAARIVALVEGSGGRVDARTEHATSGSSPAHAELTVRVPSDDLTPTLDKLGDIGTVESVNLTAEDVTAASQDLDARIAALRLSVARMEDLLARATTNADVIAAEAALSERQTSLETLESQKARMSEQVALSTLTISLDQPGAAPEPPAASPHGFWGGLVAGWRSLVAVLRVVVLVVGVLLPWLAAAGAVTALAVVARRAVRRRWPARPRQQHPQPMMFTGAPMPAVNRPGPAGPVGPPQAPPTYPAPGGTE